MTASRRIALILGAGGVFGAGWHAGTLAALVDHGWDPASAELIVGTSAGSGMVAALRAGLSPSDMYAGAVGEPLSASGQAYVAAAGGPASVPEPFPRTGRGPLSVGLTLRALLRPWKLRPMIAGAGLLPEGRVPTDFMGDRVRRTHPDGWPSEPTWICAVRVRDGARIVFGRDDTTIDIGTAVQASSSVPSRFTPVAAGGERFIDGGAHSPTNADLVAGLGFDLVIISSPMSATGAALRRLQWPGSRALHAATLRRETRRIRGAGTRVIVLEPGPAIVDAGRANSNDSAKRADIARLARVAVGTKLASEPLPDFIADTLL